MAYQWVEVPNHLPRKCPLTGNSTPDAGPYLETDFRYFDPDPNAAATGQMRLNTLYLSTEILRFALGLDGSPFANLTNKDYALLLADVKDKEQQIATLSARVAELEAGAPVTVDQDTLLRLFQSGAETSPASSAPSSHDPDDDESPRRVTKKKAAA